MSDAKDKLESDSMQRPGYAPQRWTVEQPAAAGWWWVEGLRDHPYRLVVKVGQMSGEWAARIYNQWTPLSRLAGLRWAGPLPEPLDAPTATEESVACRALLASLDRAWDELSQAALLAEKIGEKETMYDANKAWWIIDAVIRRRSQKGSEANVDAKLRGGEPEAIR